jgi:ArsR family transcriptional regulator
MTMDTLRLAARFKALAEPPRLEILALLLHYGEMCVCDVMVVLGLTQSRASRHLAVLARAGLVEGRRAGMWVHYRIAPDPDPVAVAQIAAVTSFFPADRLAAVGERLRAVRAAKARDACCPPLDQGNGTSP